MTCRVLFSLTTLLGLSCASAAFGQAAGFRYIGVLGGSGQELSTPFAIGPGSLVVGTNDYFRNNGNFRRAFQWTPSGGLQPLAGTPNSGTSSGAYAISADGSVLVGVLGIAPGSSGPAAQVFRRVNGGANEILPLAAGMFYPNVSAISGDGTTTVGTVNGYGGGGQAVTWAGTSVATPLPPLSSATSSQALGVNASGSVVVGWSGRGYPFDNVPVRWVNGQIESLGLPPECAWAWARGVSADGNTIVGLGWVMGGSSRAFKWTPQTGMTLLDGGPTAFAEAWSVSDDGRFIGGRVNTESTVWRDGVRFSVPGSLIPAGTTLTPFTGLAGNVLISHDGRTVASTERVSEAPGDAEYHAWAAVLPDWFVCQSPQVSVHLDAAAACTNGSTSVAANATGGASFLYRWQGETAPGVWADLLEGSNPLAGGSVMVQSPASATMSVDSGGKAAPARVQVRCVVSTECGSLTSSSVEVRVCPADFDCSGTVAVGDIFGFLSTWFEGAPRADWNQLDGVTVSDIFEFLGAWFTGCP